MWGWNAIVPIKDEIATETWLDVRSIIALENLRTSEKYREMSNEGYIMFLFCPCICARVSLVRASFPGSEINIEIS
jgi:hypothetical protein